ncbi:MAG: hypothetical protein M3142_06785 [Bacteroidota bacterium]|nr:hypothetical protein [Bacteroidota bacterium]
MNAEENLHLIDRYLRQELSGEELQLFEQRLKTDPLFLEEVELQKKTIQLIKETEILRALQKAQKDITDKGIFKKWPSVDAFESIEALAYREHSPREIILGSMEFPTKTPDITIPYEGDPAPPFPVVSSSGKHLFPFVRIFPASGSQTFHYRFKAIPSKYNPANIDTRLSLYGSFDPTKLTLLYHKKENKEVITLRIEAKEYSLRLNQPTAPLLEENESL